jgi:UDP-N-acetylmuramate--alanine ligase
LKGIAQHNIYFLGIGGIGMSALARHFVNMGYAVAGYDRYPSPLTNELINEGVPIHFDDDVKNIPVPFNLPSDTLVVYTPAIPSDNKEFNFFKDKGFLMQKRSATLGMLVKPFQTIAVAGTHGKTSVSTMMAWLLKNASLGCSAFLGGVSKNFNSNYLFTENNQNVVVEADEYDRSFLSLHPNLAIVTAIDPDHLEIYGNHDNVIASFNEFVKQIRPGGKLIVHKKVADWLTVPQNVEKITYDLRGNEADYYAENLRLSNGLYTFTVVGKEIRIKDIQLGVPGEVNVENAIAAIAAGLALGVTADEIKNALPGFQGVRRRLDVLFSSETCTYIDDYAHHPEEIKRLAESLNKWFPGKKITAVFQPHLYSRTRDFATGFAKSLSLFNKVYLLDIYPARELPIPGVTSQLIFDSLDVEEKTLCTKEELTELLANDTIEVLVTIGAGDIDRIRGPLVEWVKN